MSQPENACPIKPESSKTGVIFATLLVLVLFGGVVASIVIGGVAVIESISVGEVESGDDASLPDNSDSGSGGPIGKLFGSYLSNSIIQQWEQQAALGSSDAMLSLGHIYRYGDLEDELGFMSPHVEVDLQQAAHWYEQAMNAGSAQGGVALAVLHTDGLLPEADEAFGWRLMEQSAISGKSREALRLLFVRHSKNSEAPQYDLFKAIAFAETLSEMGEANYDFCANYFKLTEGLPDMMRRKGAQWMVNASANGDYRAHFTLAGLYGQGDLLDQSFDLSMAELEKAVARASDYIAADWLSYNLEDVSEHDAVKWGYISLFLRGYKEPDIRDTDYFDDVEVELTPEKDDRAFEAAKQWFADYQSGPSVAKFISLHEADTYCH